MIQCQLCFHCVEIFYANFAAEETETNRQTSVISSFGKLRVIKRCFLFVFKEKKETDID